MPSNELQIDSEILCSSDDAVGDHGFFLLIPLYMLVSL